MTTKVTLDINEKLAEKAKKHAEEQGLSLSALVETLLSDVTESKEKVLENISPKDPELVKRILDGTEPFPKNLETFFARKPKINPELEYSELSVDKKILTEELMKKYGS
ncbi:DUF6364 family protein [Algoriphagus winogradskyi]|uniref:Uncharacterized protein n=1 Tax=Algoriphagus winogradskyi TaxID=237017 RepID=A0ABY1NTV0_9BACT|nr:DUF6364 family protein [Algoriphagus winogradskyi]SMP18013.1 hypothetical protein SAMN06265367_102831 [Algoriphagus winogradskyi]